MWKNYLAAGLISLLIVALAVPAGAQDRSGMSGGQSNQGDQYGRKGQAPVQTQSGDEQKQPQREPWAAFFYIGSDKLLNAKVKDRNGKDAGSVSNLILDGSGKVAYVIISHGGFAGMGSRKISVPAGAVTVSGTGDQRTLTLNFDNEHINSSPEFNSLADLNDRVYAETLYRFFGCSQGGARKRAGACNRAALAVRQTSISCSSRAALGTGKPQVEPDLTPKNEARGAICQSPL